MSVLKKLTGLVMAMALLFTMAPRAVLAEGGEPVPKADGVTVTISNLATIPSEVWQGESDCTVQFSLKVGSENGAAFVDGQKIEVSSNIGTLFDSNWDTTMELRDDTSGEKLADITFTADKAIITIAAGAAGAYTLEGSVLFTNFLKAKDLGIEPGESQKKELTVGNASAEVLFKAKSPQPGGDPSKTDPGSVDINQLWKNVYPIENNRGASVTIEVNPLGSMDLYGDTTNGKYKMVRYENFFVEDTIPDKGYIDMDTLNIYASIPEIYKKTYDGVFNTWYEVEEDTYYATSRNVDRRLINRESADSRNRMTQLTQKDGETLDKFRVRIKSGQLQWGVYEAEDGTQTFMCNFGNLGTEGYKGNDRPVAEDNGIKYSDFTGGVCESNLKNVPEIFENSGRSAGNVMSYFISFNTYYPEIVGMKKITNHGAWNVSALYDGYQQWHGSGGNDASCDINNGLGIGRVKKNELILRLVDRDTIDSDQQEVIEGAEFTLFTKDGTGWKEYATAETDVNGTIHMGPLPDGDYKITQTGFLPGYLNDYDFRDAGNNNLKVNADGTFTVSDADRQGHAAMITNVTAKYSVEYVFESSSDNDKLPEEITDMLPEDTTVYRYGDMISAAAPAETVVVADEGAWVFKGYDKDSYAVDDKTPAKEMNTVTFTGIWEFQGKGCIIRPEDQTIYTGGTGVGDNKSFPHPIYLMEDREGNVSEITAEQLFVKGQEAPDDLFEVAYFDKDGNRITTDEQYGDYTAKIVLKDGIDVGDVMTKDGTVVFFDEGTLRIRYVSSYEDASADELTGPAVYYTSGTQDEAKTAVEEAGEAGVILPEDTKICLNGNKNYEYPADTESQIALFFDTLLPAEPNGDVSAFEEQLAAHAGEKGQEIDGWQTQYRYLDLVDMNNSNAWVSSSEGSDIFWPYPEGVDKTDEMKLLHFEGLHREYRMEGEDGLGEQIAVSEVTEVRIKKTDTGIWFHVPESGFSPFVLMWKDTYGVSYKFESGTDGKDLPQSVLNLLPSDSRMYPAGETVVAIDPAKTKVNDGDGVWSFQGWDKDTKPAAAGVEFIGTWTFRVGMSSLNMIPEITAEDKTLTVGDEFDPLKDPTAFDKEDGNITEDLEVIKNEVDTSTAGQYEVTYKVTDSKGASAIKTIVVTVVDHSEPETPDDNPTPEGPDNNPTPEGPEDKPTADHSSDTTGEPTDSGKPASEAVQTGDDANPIFWITLSIIAGAAVIVTAGCLYIRNQGRTHRRRNK